MANLIKLRRSAEQGKIPTTAQLDLGELAINTNDGKVFLKRYDGLNEYIVEVGGNVGFSVKNKTGTLIPKGTLVMFAGTIGASSQLLVQPFLANGTYPSDYIVGVLQDDIANDASGFAIDHGKIRGLNTSAWPENTILYASSTTTGGFTSTQPQAPNNKITVAAVISSHATNGSIEVRITLGSQLGNDELVELSNLQNYDTIVYNSSAGRFENKAAGSLVGTGIDQVTTITKSITLTTDWQDTGINSIDLATGTYIVQLFANDISAGGSNNNEYYSGTMSWYSGTVNSSIELPTDEIPLHRAGGSSDAGLYLRTYRSANSSLKLQIYSNAANASASNYVFKFRRVI